MSPDPELKFFLLASNSSSHSVVISLGVCVNPDPGGHMGSTLFLLIVSGLGSGDGGRLPRRITSQRNNIMRSNMT